MKYVSNMIAYTTEFYKYQKAYYLAYGWTELNLTKIAYRGFGFQDKVEATSQTVVHNLSYCGDRCSFSTNIHALTKVVGKDDNAYILNSCSIWNAIDLGQGEWIIVPLFIDNVSGVESSVDQIAYTKIPSSEFSQIEINISHWQNKRFSVAVVDDNLATRKIQQINTPSDPYNIGLNNAIFQINSFYNGNLEAFLVVANNESWSSKMWICVDSNSRIVAPKVVLQSQWTYLDRTVSLELIKQKTLPDYLIYNVIN